MKSFYLAFPDVELHNTTISRPLLLTCLGYGRDTSHGRLFWAEYQDVLQPLRTPCEIEENYKNQSGIIRFSEDENFPKEVKESRFYLFAVEFSVFFFQTVVVSTKEILIIQLSYH